MADQPVSPTGAPGIPPRLVPLLVLLAGVLLTVRFALLDPRPWTAERYVEVALAVVMVLLGAGPGVRFAPPSAPQLALVPSLEPGESLPVALVGPGEACAHPATRPILRDDPEKGSSCVRCGAVFPAPPQQHEF